MATSRQDQTGGDGSVNIQGHNVTQNITVGLSVSEAIELFKANFYEMKEQAAQVAVQRVEKLVNQLVDTAVAAKVSLEEARTPDMQYALITAQTAYARTGDQRLGDLLVELLINRAKQPERNLMQIVLNESLAVAPKLTGQQIDTLSLVWLLLYTRSFAVNTLEGMERYLRNEIAPFASNLTKKASCYQHIQFTGCGSIDIGEHQLEPLITQTYPGLLSRGFSDAELAAVFPGGAPPSMITKSLHDPTLLQVKAAHPDVLDEMATNGLLTAEQATKLKALLTDRVMPPDQVRAWVISRVPELAGLFECWNGSHLKNMKLTSVGMAIAAANARRRAGINVDLSIWV